MSSHSLSNLWASALDERDSYILQKRLETTLQVIGDRLSLSRERVRQLERLAQASLKAALVAEYGENELPGLRSNLNNHLAVNDEYLWSLLGAAPKPITQACMRAIGVVPMSVWGVNLDGWWTSRPKLVNAAFKELVADAPFRSEEVPARARSVGLPDGVPCKRVLEAAASPLRLHPAGPWLVRRSAVHRDAIYLWLLEQGEPATIGPIANAVGQLDNAAREGMRRDERFVLLRPTGYWSLVEWNLPHAGYSGALEAVLATLENMGPLPYETVLLEVRKVYPVTDWRIAQCLNSTKIGRMPNGDIGLTRDGGLPIEEEAPKRPSNVKESEDSSVIAFTLPVDYDLLRGSGIVIPKYVGWRIGLRHAPQSREFGLGESEESILITRNLSGTQMTALRRWAIELGVQEGCRLAITLRLENDKARILHGCSAGDCALSENVNQ